MKKDLTNVVTDLSGNAISPINWGPNQPNGGDLQQCLTFMAQYSAYNDVDCDSEACFACLMPSKFMYHFRGILPFHTERNYFVSMTGKKTEIRGFSESICSWNQTWQFGSNLKEDDDSNEVKSNLLPPVGLNGWNNGTMLKFTNAMKLSLPVTLMDIASHFIKDVIKHLIVLLMLQMKRVVKL